MVCTLLISLPALFNVASLLFLAFFIFAVLGMSQFANVRLGENLSPTANFRYFDSSLLLLTRMVTGEGWNAIMHDCMVQPPACTGWYGLTTDGIPDLAQSKFQYTASNAPLPNGGVGQADYWLPNDCGSEFGALLYFITFQLIGNYMVVNLFVAVILDNYAFMANVGDAEISEFVLTKFRKTWYLITLKDKHVNKHLGKYMRVAKLRDFLTKLGAPLGIVLWDARGMTKYETIKDEVRRMSTPGLGISYRRMQYILCIHAMAEDPACEMPLDEYEKRQTELDAVARMRCANLLQAAYRGRRGRSALGVVGVAKSEKEEKADAFKKRFANMMNSPSKALSPPKRQASLPAPVSSPSPAPGSPSPVPASPAPMASLSPGVTPNAPSASPTPATNNQAAATAEVRNVFRERAMARAAAKSAKK